MNIDSSVRERAMRVLRRLWEALVDTNPPRPALDEDPLAPAEALRAATDKEHLALRLADLRHLA